MSTSLRSVAVRQPRPALAWEEPACLLCGGRERTTLLEAQDPQASERGLWFAVVTCGQCGLAFTSPRPDELSIEDFYPMDYAPHRPKRDHRVRWAPFARLRGRPCVERRVLEKHGKCRLLDFGCGGGSFLERMHRQGWNVTGIDASPAAVATVERRLGLPAFLGSLPNPQLVPGSFDVITMWHSLEHVHNPLRVLQAAKELLAPDGKLLVAVPNIDGLPFRWFGSSWFALDLPRHLSHFKPDTLRAMLAKTGFETIKIRQIRHDDWLRSSAKLACSRPHPTLWQKLLSNKVVSRFMAWACYVLGRSDCMLATATKSSRPSPDAVVRESV